MREILSRKRKVLILGMAISVMVVACCQYGAYQENKRLKEGFVWKQPDNVYARQEELTKDSIASVEPRSRNLAPIEPIGWSWELTADLHYYRKPGDWIPEKVYLKGTKVMVQVNAYGEPEKYTEIAASGKYNYIYGTRSYPSYQKGWRVVVPFLTNTEYNKGKEPEYELLYIRTSEMEKLKRVFIQKGLVEPSPHLGPDQRLYEEGYYLSPDLYRSYFPAPVKVVIWGWIGILAGSLIRHLRRIRV